jgi:hypothetical protein
VCVHVQIGDLIDMIVHGLRGALYVPSAQSSNHGFVPVDGSCRAALLPQRLRARIHEQIVERRHDAHDHAVARGSCQDGMKRRVLGDGRLTGLQLLPLRFQDALQIGQIFVGRAQGCGARDGGLEHPAHIQKLILQIGPVGHHRSQGCNQAVHRKLVRKRALPVPRLEKTNRFQRAQRVADRSAAHAEPFRQMAFRGQGLAGGKRAVQHEHPDPVGNFLGNARFLDRSDEANLIAGLVRKTLDSVPCGWYIFVIKWFNHWSTVPQMAMSEKLFEFVTPGSPRAVSGAIEQLAIGQGSLTAIVVPWESDRTSLSMAVASSQGEGWALEHTNLGTVRLTDMGNETTRVEVFVDLQGHAEHQKLAKLFARFSSQIQSQLQVAQ